MADLDARERRMRRGGEAASPRDHFDAILPDIGDESVRYGKAARARAPGQRLKHDAAEGQVANDTVGDGQRVSGVEDDAVLAGAGPLDDQAAQVDLVA